MSIHTEKPASVAPEHPTLVLHQSRSAMGTGRPAQAPLTTEPQPPDATNPETSPALPQIPGYDLLSVLGVGGMGVVYLARQRSLDRQVALKMIRPEVERDPELLARFEAEATAVARLHHPGIVQVYEVGTHEGRPFLCLELIEGTTLEAWIGGKPHDPAASATLAEQLALALHHAHKQGIIHRDMKPANVLLDAESRPHVTDFGIARFLQSQSQGLTQHNELLGTPTYMAPEQTRQEPIAATTDVYALGVILYEMLTGRPPFVALTGFETIQLLQSVEPVAPRRLQPGIPRDLETITLKCLRKDPAQRYPTAQALAEDLQRWRAGEPIHARPISLFRRMGSLCYRNPGTTALTAGLLLALLTLGVLTQVWHRAAEEQRLADAQRVARLQSEHERLEKALQEDLTTIEKALRTEDVTEAREALQHAQGLLGLQPARPEIAERLKTYEGHIELILALDGVHSRLGQARGDSFDAQGRSDELQALLKPLGIQLNQPFDPAWIEPLRQSILRWKLIETIDLWAFMRVQVNDPVGARWLLELSSRIDPDGWCSEARRDLLARDGDKLVQRGRQIRQEKHSRQRWRLMATLLRFAQQHEEAKEVYRAGLLEHPNDFLLASGLGLILMNETQPDSWREAIGCFRAALAIRPNSAGVQLNAGYLFSRLNQPHEALAAYQRAAEIQPEYAMAFYNQGRILGFLNRLPEAVTAYERAIALDPANRATYYHLTAIHARMGRLDLFRAGLDRLEKAEIYRSELADELAEELDQNRLDHLALEFRQRCLKVDGNNPQLLYNFGTAMLERYRHAEAVEILRRAVDLRPEHPETWCNLGLALTQMGRFDEAIETLCRGHQLGTRQPQWRYTSDQWLAEANRLSRLALRQKTTPMPDLIRSLDMEGLLALAQLQAIQGEYRLSALTYLNALQRQNQNPNAPVSGEVPWLAARVALRAGLGHGLHPPEADQQRLYRKQAEQLIESQLNVLEHWLNLRNPATVRKVKTHLENCLQLNALSDFRRIAQSDDLPEAERTTWRELFERAESLRNRAGSLVEELAAGK